MIIWLEFQILLSNLNPTHPISWNEIHKANIAL